MIGAGCAGYTAYTTYQAGWDIADIIWYTIGSGLGGFLTVYTLGMSAYQLYVNYCMLNGITPVTDIGSHTSSQTPHHSTPQTSKNPLEDITYTEKVHQQKQQSDFHGFPDIVDNYGGLGHQQTIIGGDGNTYQKLSIPGSYLGRDGAFVYMWNEYGICNHRCFETCHISLR